MLLKLNKFLLMAACYLQAKILILTILEHFSNVYLSLLVVQEVLNQRSQTHYPQTSGKMKILQEIFSQLVYFSRRLSINSIIFS